MTNFKKISFFTAVFALILGLNINTSYAQVEDQPSQPDTTYTLMGKVVDAETGQALADVEVKITGDEGVQTGQDLAEMSETTGQEGEFTFDELPAGTHTIKVEAEGYEKWEKRVALERDSQLTIELKPGM